MLLPGKIEFPGTFRFQGKFRFLGNVTKPVSAVIYFPGNDSNFQKNFSFWRMSLNQFMQPGISREMSIPRKCDFPGKFEFPGKLEFLGSVTLA